MRAMREKWIERNSTVSYRPSRPEHSWFLRRRIGLDGCGLRFQLPKHIDDLPITVELRDFKVIDPVRRDDLNHSGVIESIEDGDFFQLSISGRLCPAAIPCPLHQRHRAHVIELAAARL